MSLRLNGLLALAIGVLPISANAATQVFTGLDTSLRLPVTGNTDLIRTS